MLNAHTLCHVVTSLTFDPLTWTFTALWVSCI